MKTMRNNKRRTLHGWELDTPEMRKKISMETALKIDPKYVRLERNCDNTVKSFYIDKNADVDALASAGKGHLWFDWKRD